MDATSTLTADSITAADAMERLTDPGNVGTLEERTITHSIELHRVGDTATLLQLEVHHWKEARRYAAHLQVVGLEDRGDYTVRVTTPFVRSRSRRLPSQDVARYSTKSLMAFRDETMAMLRREYDWLDLDLSPWGTSTPDPAEGALSLAKL